MYDWRGFHGGDISKDIYPDQPHPDAESRERPYSRDISNMGGGVGEFLPVEEPYSLPYESKDGKKDYLFVRSRTIPSPIKDKVRERDSNQCVVCEKENNLEFHHIIPVRWNDKFDQDCKDVKWNIALLCRKCHTKAHRNGEPGFRGVWYDSVKEFWDWVAEGNREIIENA